MIEETKEIPLPLEETVLSEVFKAEVRFYAEEIGVKPNSIILRPMTKKWASCSSKGNISFDVDILQKPASFRRKVIVHELLHLKVPNHGKLFKALEQTYLANMDL